jgi:shikimate dehydrogenase
MPVEIAPVSGDASAEALRLGLIGDNIAASRAPMLHRLAGELAGIAVTYDRFVPREMNADFDAVLMRCRDMGLRGVNVTYPYKERVMAHVAVCDDLVRRIGSANTIVFSDDGIQAYNTDHSGFVAAYRETFADMPPGIVAQIGAGGVGRAVAFGLAALGADEIRLVEKDPPRAHALKTVLSEAFPKAPRVSVHDGVAACDGADAVVNCTPIGMVGIPGTPVPAARLAGIGWAFDAVYTPVETAFKADAEAAGARVLSGFELFFHQGVHAFERFSGRRPRDAVALRRALIE